MQKKRDKTVLPFIVYRVNRIWPLVYYPTFLASLLINENKGQMQKTSSASEGHTCCIQNSVFL